MKQTAAAAAFLARPIKFENIVQSQKKKKKKKKKVLKYF
jgi:hypothetical protein